MKLKVVVRTVGTLLKMLGILLLIPGVVAAIYREPSGVMAFAVTSVLTALCGSVMERMGEKGDPGNKEAFAIVTIAWIAAAVFGAMPFALQGIDIPSALFESMSGWSATGATILNESGADGYYVVNRTLASNSLSSALANVAASAIGINSFPVEQFLNDSSVHAAIPSPDQTFRGLLFWRSFSQLLGGLGIILLFVAIFPHLGVAGRQLYRAEAVGPTKDTIAPRASHTARILWGVYLAFNAIEITMLLAAGMPLYDAICNSFSSLATGGFSPQSSSIAAYNSPLIEAIIAVFMFLGACSFSMHYTVLCKDKTAWLKDPELRFFVLILAVATLILVFFGGINGDILHRFRLASFQTISFMATCGFVNTMDYDKWSTAAKLTLIILMLIGGAIGSTAGGIKVGRLLICLKYAQSELFHMIHPKAMTPVRLGSSIIRDDVLRPILFYSFFYLGTFLAMSLLLAIVEAGDPRVDLLVVTSGVASCMGGVGPGFGIITFDWSAMNAAAKMVGFFCMFMGRLEILPILLLVIPDLWKK